ncbi:MAG: glycosyltransferase family 39 protein, partial [Marinobacter sp.]|nr:glycosyltransferase family 39 protein [Marinobacter sp.]
MLKNRQLLFWLLVAVVVSRLLTMFSVPLADMTEPRYAEIARVMAATGDWITPWFHLNVPFWGKPPLSFWCQALSFKLFGVSEFTGRLPSWLATVGMLALVMRLASTLADRRVGLWAGLIFSTMALTYISAGTVMTDSFLALGTTLSLVSFAMVLSGHKRGWRWGPFIGLIIGLLAKGPLTLILLGTPVFFWALWSRGWKTLFTELPWGRGLLLTV